MNLLRRIRDHERPARLPDGTRVFLRPLRDADLAHAREFFAGLSERSRYLRFMAPTPELTPETLAALLRAMHESRSAVVVVVLEHAAGQEELLGGARIVPSGQRGTCEFALTIVDRWQGRGVGSVLMREVVRRARLLGYRHVEGLVLTANTRMLAIAQRHRFRICTDPNDPGMVRVTRALRP